MKTKIYALRDVHWIRYVGKTVKALETRLASHLTNAQSGKRNHRCNWIRSLLARGYLPSITLIQVVDGNGNKEERKWIEYFKSHAIELVNGTEGGDGGDTRSGKKNSSAHNKKVSIALTGRKASKKACLNISIAKKGVSLGPTSIKTRRKISATLMNHDVSAKSRTQMSESQIKLWGSSRHRKKMSAAHKGQIPWNKGKTDKKTKAPTGNPHQTM